MKTKLPMLVLLAFAMISAAALATSPPVHPAPPQVTKALLEDVLNAVSRTSGEKFLVSYAVQPEVTLGPADVEDINYLMLHSVLRNNELAAIEINGVINIIPANRIRQYPIRRLDKDDKKVSDDEWVLRTITVQNSDAAQYVPILRPLIANEGYLVTHPSSNTLVFSARYGMVKRITELVTEMDRKPQRPRH